MKNCKLRDCSALSEASDREIERLSKESVLRDYQRHEVIIEEGEKSQYVYIVLEGIVRGFKTRPDGRQASVEVFSKGDIIGEFLIMNSSSCTYSVEAVTTVSLVMVKKETLGCVIRENPEVCERIMNLISKKLVSAENRMGESLGEKIEQRFARILLMLFGKTGSRIPFTRIELAGMAGTATETAYRVSGSMKEYGIIKTTRGVVTVLNPEKLRNLAEGIPLGILKGGLCLKK